jgi:hypothetical protein
MRILWIKGTHERTGQAVEKTDHWELRVLRQEMTRVMEINAACS